MVDLTFAASTVGQVTPAPIAKAKKDLFTNGLSGKPKEILLAPMLPRRRRAAMKEGWIPQGKDKMPLLWTQVHVQDL